MPRVVHWFALSLVLVVSMLARKYHFLSCSILSCNTARSIYEVVKGSCKLIKNFDLNDLSVFRFTLDYHFAGIELLERR